MAYEQFAGHYDRLMEDMPYDRWLRFVRHSWERYGNMPHRVVDLGCGTGSLTLPLAQDGLHMTGIDLSENMLAVAHSKQQRAASAISAGGGSVAWLQQDMREWELGEQVDAAISLCDCINYLLEEEDVRSMLRSTAAGLRAGGLFIFDMHAPAQLAAYAAEQPFFLNDDDIAYIWTSDYDEARRQIEHDLTIFVQQQNDSPLFERFTERHVQRAYTVAWMDDALRQSGFDVLDCCADFAWTAPHEDSSRIFFVAKKK